MGAVIEAAIGAAIGAVVGEVIVCTDNERWKPYHTTTRELAWHRSHGNSVIQHPSISIIAKISITNRNLACRSVAVLWLVSHCCSLTSPYQRTDRAFPTSFLGKRGRKGASR